MATEVHEPSARIRPRIMPPAEAGRTFDEYVATYAPDEAVAEARRALALGFDLAAAQQGCPFHVDIPRYVAQLAAEDIDGALATIRDAHPFPSVMGRMCHFFCERAPGVAGPPAHGQEAANGGSEMKPGQRPALRDLERYVGDYGDPARSPVESGRPPSGKRVAVIGAGSGGLAGAWMLRRLGHEVDVYDNLPVPGGMLFLGYPPFRMAKYGVRRDDDPTSWGVRFIGSHRIDRAELERIIGEYDLTLVTTGNNHPHLVGIPGEDAEGVWAALDFIGAVSFGQPPPGIRRLLVVGGGGTARDASRTAQRLGAQTTVCYRRSRQLMDLGGGPFGSMSDPEAGVRMHEAEGIDFEFLVQPVRIVADAANRVVGVEFVRTEMGPPDESGRPSFRLLPGTEFTIACDTVVEAVGAEAELGIFPELIHTERGRVIVDHADHWTTHPKVFAAGDITGLHGNDIAAQAAIQAARTMDSLLRGEPLVRFSSEPLRFPPGTGDA